ncbi:globoside alpha-1,3-N-acetylgalactosaminyltransferase 1-like isoform X2 [Mugil cephalus]|uniref:globoside alpha-1,3-N-acetylgalactosaminyltransferase 1-like isoform X2 n=1 Tax=Mugil cephalus TaxID=48193 RepID=UPI001FB70EE3|nr:globoside alpha-1,3-N-acetylgalactosaminyltransferase 1-like isoform X2 [Mugil cephalus]
MMLFFYTSPRNTSNTFTFEDTLRPYTKTLMCRETEGVATKHLVIPESLQVPQPRLPQKSRGDVLTVTPWLAPIVWEGTFNPLLIENIYKPKNISIAVTVFAVGKYIRFLKDFLETAEKYFFVGYKVHVYVYTDQPNDVPKVKMGPNRQVTVRLVPNAKRWQEITSRRLNLIEMLIEEKLRGNTDYIFCLDVDCKFHGPWGPESLGELFGAIHPGYYQDDRKDFPYERRPISRAYLAPGVGDFYYGAAVFGGSLDEVVRLAQVCSQNFDADTRDGIEAAWQEESHLNKYFWVNKPTKVLSPEYLWQDFKPINPEIHVMRFSGIIKNYKEIRPNWDE